MLPGAVLAALLAVPVAGEPLPGARAAGPGDLTVEVVGSCPDEAEVRRLMAGLVSPEEARGATLTIHDRGSNYRLTVGDAAATLDDPARDCAARARQVAIIAAAALRAAHPLISGPPKWTIEKGFTFEVASGPGGHAVWAPGVEMRGALGSGTWSLFGAAGARGPATSSLENAWKVEMLRFPLDLGARVTMYRWRLRPWLTLAPSLTPTSFLGTELLNAKREWRVDPGALAMMGATLPVKGRIGVSAALTARWVPRQHHLQVAPFGTVAETPTWWFGLTLNYVVDGERTSP